MIPHWVKKQLEILHEFKPFFVVIKELEVRTRKNFCTVI